MKQKDKIDKLLDKKQKKWTIECCEELIETYEGILKDLGSWNYKPRCPFCANSSDTRVSWPDGCSNCPLDILHKKHTPPLNPGCYTSGYGKLNKAEYDWLWNRTDKNRQKFEHQLCKRIEFHVNLMMDCEESLK